MIGELPLKTGGFHETVAEFVPATVVIPVGAVGSEADGVTDVVEEEAEELPAEFIAVTVNVTGVPLANPLSVVLNTLPTVNGLPTDGVIMYPVIGEPPFEAGGFQVTVAEPLPLETETPVIAPGAVAGAIGVAAAEADADLPTAFIATTVNVRDVPLGRLFRLADRTLPTVTGLPVDGVTVYAVISE